jgi:hypothetical protein
MQATQAAALPMKSFLCEVLNAVFQNSRHGKKWKTNLQNVDKIHLI